MGKLAHKGRGQMEEERRVGMQERERIYQRRDRKGKMDKNRHTDIWRQKRERGCWLGRLIDKEMEKWC